ncbi:DUF2442 domain-containing protein [Arthrospira platensis SPKY1]|nr:DUF2442 domain-containing protein [Arthrospira platensis SPKY1]
MMLGTPTSTSVNRPVSVEFSVNGLTIQTQAGLHFIAMEDLPRTLQTATTEARETFTISPSGYGIHWPLLDEDLSLKGLLALAVPLTPPTP